MPSASLADTMNGAQTRVTTMTSLEIAELTDKRHDNIMEDIRKMLNDLGKAAPEFSGTAEYTVNNAIRTREIFNLPKRECLILVSGYSVQLRAKIIDRWQGFEGYSRSATLSASSPIRATVSLCAGKACTRAHSTPHS